MNAFALAKPKINVITSNLYRISKYGHRFYLGSDEENKYCAPSFSCKKGVLLLGNTFLTAAKTKFEARLAKRWAQTIAKADDGSDCIGFYKKRPVFILHRDRRAGLIQVMFVTQGRGYQLRTKQGWAFKTDKPFTLAPYSPMLSGKHSLVIVDRMEYAKKLSGEKYPEIPQPPLFDYWASRAKMEIDEALTDEEVCSYYASFMRNESCLPETKIFVEEYILAKTSITKKRLVQLRKNVIAAKKIV